MVVAAIEGLVNGHQGPTHVTWQGDDLDPYSDLQDQEARLGARRLCRPKNRQQYLDEHLELEA
eukprot:8147010-Karenia_brevis.AAC.1